MRAGERASCRHGVSTDQQPIGTEEWLTLFAGSTMDYRYNPDYSSDGHTRDSAPASVQGAPNAFKQEA
jgi:hypothetical protein